MRAYQRSSARISANSRIASRYDRADRELDRFALLGVESAIAAGDREARHEPLDVPLERPGQRLVEVVDAEHQPPVGSRERAEVRQMRVAAELHVQARARRTGEVGRHQGGAAAVERERRDEHAPVADRHQLRHARLRLLLEHVDRITPARRRLPPRVRRARHLGARRLPPRRPLRPREMRDAARLHARTPRPATSPVPLRGRPCSSGSSSLARPSSASNAVGDQLRLCHCVRRHHLRIAPRQVEQPACARAMRSRFRAAGRDAPDSNTPPERRPHPNGTKSTTAKKVPGHHVMPVYPRAEPSQDHLDGMHLHGVPGSRTWYSSPGAVRAFETHFMA